MTCCCPHPVVVAEHVLGVQAAVVLRGLVAVLRRELVRELVDLPLGHLVARSHLGDLRPHRRDLLPVPAVLARRGGGPSNHRRS